MASADIKVVMQQTSSLLNAAGYRMSAQAAIDSGTDALTMSDASLTADNVGESIAIDGAGAGGTIYVGTITAVGSDTTCTVSPVVGATVVGACASYGGRLEDDRHNLQELREAAIEADDEVYIALGETAEHWARPEVETETVVTHNAKLPNHIGTVVVVMIKPNASDQPQRGKPADYETIQRYLANTGSPPNDVYGDHLHDDAGSPLGGYYHIDGNSWIVFTGTSATALMLLYTDPRTSNLLQSPASLTGILVFNTARRMYKQGAIDTYFNAFSTIGRDGIAGIRANSRAVPDPTAFEMPEGQQKAA